MCSLALRAYASAFLSPYFATAQYGLRRALFRYRSIRALGCGYVLTSVARIRLRPPSAISLPYSAQCDKIAYMFALAHTSCALRFGSLADVDLVCYAVCFSECIMKKILSIYCAFIAIAMTGGCTLETLDTYDGPQCENVEKIITKGYCISTDSTNANYNGANCKDGNICVAGKCILNTCPSGYTLCDSNGSRSCVNVNADDNYNCGACGYSCIDNYMSGVELVGCNLGKCRYRCPDGYTNGGSGDTVLTIQCIKAVS